MCWGSCPLIEPEALCSDFERGLRVRKKGKLQRPETTVGSEAGGCCRGLASTILLWRRSCLTRRGRRTRTAAEGRVDAPYLSSPARE